MVLRLVTYNLIQIKKDTTMTISIGSDPEVMLREKSTGRIISAAGLIGGSKGEPRHMDGLPEGYGVQEDNVMVEYNIPPATTSSSFSRRVTSGLIWIQEYIAENYPLLELDDRPCRVLQHDQLQHPKAQEFGCAPDFDAYDEGRKTGGTNHRTLRTPSGEWRFNGGHVHIGYDHPDIPKFVAARFADLFLVLRSIGLDAQGMRRTMYGQAGRFRPTTYGIEVRALSNFWIFDSATSLSVGTAALLCGEYLEGTDAADIRRHYAAVPWSDVQRAINCEDAHLAADVLAYANNELSLGV